MRRCKGLGGIGNVRTWRQTRIWKSQVHLKRKLLVVCRVAAAAPENKWRKEEGKEGARTWEYDARCAGSSLFVSLL